MESLNNKCINSLEYALKLSDGEKFSAEKATRFLQKSFELPTWPEDLQPVCKIITTVTTNLNIGPIKKKLIDDEIISISNFDVKRRTLQSLLRFFFLLFQTQLKQKENSEERGCEVYLATHFLSNFLSLILPLFKRKILNCFECIIHSFITLVTTTSEWKIAPEQYRMNNQARYIISFVLEVDVCSSLL